MTSRVPNIYELTCTAILPTIYTKNLRIVGCILSIALLWIVWTLGIYIPFKALKLWQHERVAYRSEEQETDLMRDLAIKKKIEFDNI